MEYIKTIKSGFDVLFDKSAEYISNLFENNSNLDTTTVNLDHDDNQDNSQEIIITQPTSNNKPKYILTKDGQRRHRIFPPLSLISQMKVFFSTPHHIIDNIYLGSAFNASHSSTLKNLNIGLIINVTSEISNYYPNKYKYKKYNIIDNNSDSIKEYFKDSYKTILEYQQHDCKEQKKNILVHCYMGASRSVSIVIYYLMKKHNYKLNEAIHFLKNKRAVVNPTILFYKELYDSQQSE